jgi:hypothetical protein
MTSTVRRRDLGIVAFLAFHTFYDMWTACEQRRLAGFCRCGSIGERSKKASISDQVCWKALPVPKSTNMKIICPVCGRDIDAISQDNMSYGSSPICEDCAGEQGN